MAIVVKGDAMSPESLQKAFDGIEDVDAVISTIGGTPADPSVDSQVRSHFHSTCDCVCCTYGAQTSAKIVRKTLTSETHNNSILDTESSSAL